MSDLLTVYWEPLWKYAGPHARSGKPASARLGPVGGGGNPFDDTSRAQRISSIDVRSGEIIDGIRVTHSDGTADPLRGGTGIPVGSAGITTLNFDAADPLIGVSGEWGAWYGGIYITKIQFHRRSGSDSQVFGTGASATNTQAFDLRAASPAIQEVTGFFGTIAAADNGNSQCLASIGIAVQ